MTFPGALGRSTRPWSQAMLSTGFGRAPKSVTSRAGALFLSQNLRRRGGAGSAGCASRYRAWRRPRRGILPAQVNGRWESETARRTSQNCDLFSGIEMVCPKEAENWNPDDEKWENTPVNGRLPRFCEGVSCWPQGIAFLATPISSSILCTRFSRCWELYCCLECLFGFW